jgi:hypothetical protein
MQGRPCLTQRGHAITLLGASVGGFTFARFAGRSCAAGFVASRSSLFLVGAFPGPLPPSPSTSGSVSGTGAGLSTIMASAASTAFCFPLAFSDMPTELSVPSSTSSTFTTTGSSPSNHQAGVPGSTEGVARSEYHWLSTIVWSSCDMAVMSTTVSFRDTSNSRWRTLSMSLGRWMCGRKSVGISLMRRITIF